MVIWVDGDACPRAIRDIVCRAAIKRQILTNFVANHIIDIPLSQFLKRIVVPKRFDAADHQILSLLQASDLVITADILLADQVVSRQALALNPRGTLYSQENIKHTLALRNHNQMLRESGAISGGSAPLSPKEIQIFSNHFDRILTHRGCVEF